MPGRLANHGFREGSGAVFRDKVAEGSGAGSGRGFREGSGAGSGQGFQHGTGFGAGSQGGSSFDQGGFQGGSGWVPGSSRQGSRRDVPERFENDLVADGGDRVPGRFP